MGFLKNKKFIIPVSLVVIIVLGFFAVSILSPVDKISDQENEVLGEKQSNVTEESIIIDFDGDGIGEILNVSEKEGEVVAKEVNMELFDSEGNKIAELWDGINLYPTTLYKIVKLNENSEREYLQWDMAVGPHQIETVFLTIVSDMVHPIYSIDFENNTMYTPFYTSRGSLVVADANYDGLVEIIENVDEYPVDAPRLEDPEIENMIREQFASEGVDFIEDNTKELVEKDDVITGGMLKIIKRENNGIGRGRKTLMAIHSFVEAETPFFRRLPEDEYEEIAGPIVAASQDIASQDIEAPEGWETDSMLRYSDLEQDSRDFNDFVRDFWTHGRPYENTIE